MTYLVYNGNTLTKTFVNDNIYGSLSGCCVNFVQLIISTVILAHLKEKAQCLSSSKRHEDKMDWNIRNEYTQTSWAQQQWKLVV